MKSWTNRSIDRSGLSALIVMCLGVGAAGAQDDVQPDAEPTLEAAAELSFVSTEGNSESQTFGFGLDVTREAGRNKLNFRLRGVRAESQRLERTATGTVDEPMVVETRTDVLTADNLHADIRYDRVYGEHLGTFVSLSWDANEFAGFESRTSLAWGITRTWWDNEETEDHLHTDLALAYTDQRDLVTGPDSSPRTVGLHAGYDWGHKLTATTDWHSQFGFDVSFEDTSDFRGDLVSSIAVAVTERIALKVALQLLYDHQPALALVPLEGEEGLFVPVELERLDAQLTIAVVVDF